jgi:hypothetical protein
MFFHLDHEIASLGLVLDAMTQSFVLGQEAHRIAGNESGADDMVA